MFRSDVDKFVEKTIEWRGRKVGVSFRRHGEVYHGTQNYIINWVHMDHGKEVKCRVVQPLEPSPANLVLLFFSQSLF